MYGLWINPIGERIICLEQGSHSQHCDYETAFNHGWVAIVYGQQFLCIRINPAATSNRVYNEVLKVIKEHDGERILLEDTFASGFGNVNTQDSSKKYIRSIIQQLKSGKLILTERFHDDRPHRGYAQYERKLRRKARQNDLDGFSKSNNTSDSSLKERVST